MPGGATERVVASRDGLGALLVLFRHVGRILVSADGVKPILGELQQPLVSSPDDFAIALQVGRCTLITSLAVFLGFA